ncbi:uncharacterized protein [Mytilus edulis]|uniref:uncharacterized protein n=1 Tax=Mytilus edulis TaxID=6550 RepID=UPI0039F08D12
MRKVDLRNMQCTIHGKEKCFIYCKDCSEPACSKCMIEVHQKHEYKALDEAYDGHITDIKEVEDKIESNLQFLKKEKDKLQKMLSNGDTNFQETREIILQAEKELKDAISEHTKELLQELETKWKPSESIIKTELSAIIKYEDELVSRKNNLIQVLQSHQVIDIFSTSKTLDKSLQKYSVKQMKQNKTKFISSNMQVKTRSHMLGDLYTIPELELIDTYQSDVEKPPCILLSGDNTAFIGSSIDKKLQKITFENNNSKVEKEVPIGVFDISLTKDGDILMSLKESDLKLYTTNGQLKTFKSFSQLKTLGVHVTKDNKLLVGLRESIPVTFPPTKEVPEDLSF